MNRSTWYVLENGTAVDPNDCAPGEDGVMRHSSGVPVAMRGNAYSSRGVDLDNLPKPPKAPKAAKPEKESAPAPVTREEGAEPSPPQGNNRMLEAEQPAPVKPKRPYRTRGSKAKD